MRILYIANLFYPINGSASIRNYYYVRELERNHKITVLTAKYPKNHIRYTKSLEDELESLKTIPLYQNMGCIYKLLYPKKNEKISKNFSRKKGKNKYTLFSFIKKTLKIFKIPDAYIFWALLTYNSNRNAEHVKNTNVILASMESRSSLILGALFKRKYMKKTLILYYSDPWTLSKDFLHKGMLIRLVESFLEKWVIKLSDKIIFSTEETKQIYINKYNMSEKNLYTLTRGFDTRKFYLATLSKPLIFEESFTIDQNIVVSYTGDLYSQYRNIIPFIEGLEKLKKEHKKAFNKLEFHFVGGIFGYDESTLNRLYNLNLNFHDRVDYNESIKIMQNSDYLLLFANKGNLQIPGKIYEYLGSNSKVLSISEKYSDSVYQIMEKYPKGFNIINNTEIITDTLLKMSKYSKTDKTNNKLSYNEFSWSNIGEKLEEIL